MARQHGNRRLAHASGGGLLVGARRSVCGGRKAPRRPKVPLKPRGADVLRGDGQVTASTPATSADTPTFPTSLYAEVTSAVISAARRGLRAAQEDPDEVAQLCAVKLWGALRRGVVLPADPRHRWRLINGYVRHAAAAWSADARKGRRSAQLENADGTCIDDAPGPEEVYERAQLLAAIARFRMGLEDERDRQIANLWDGSGDVDRVARALSVSASTVYARRKVLLADLLKCLRRGGFVSTFAAELGHECR